MSVTQKTEVQFFPLEVKKIESMTTVSRIFGRRYRTESRKVEHGGDAG